MYRTRFRDIAGQKFGRLLVVEIDTANVNKRIRWICKCDCGNTISVSGGNIKSGHTVSCGCFRTEKSKIPKIHGLSQDPLHNVWCLMRRRCYDIRRPEYKYYGGRGIKVCEQWDNNFLPFYQWALSNGYKSNLTIDRIDNDGNYEPLNCRWATMSEQCNNKSSNRLLTYLGKTQNLSQWAIEYNMNPDTLRARIYVYGFSMEKSLTKPSKNYVKRTYNKTRKICNIL